MQFSRTIRSKSGLILIWLITGWSAAYAQTNAVSPLTVYGIGDLSEGYFAQNYGLGGAAIAMRDPLYINVANPASYTAMEFTTLETAVSMRFVQQQIKETNQKLTNQSSYFNYFGLGFKLKDWWGMSLSVSPYSFVGYNIYTTDSLADFGDVLYEFQGNGGINQAVFGNGFEPFKNFSIGINVRYLFGTYDRSDAVLFNNSQFYNSKRLRTNGVNSVATDFGMQYLLPLKNNYEVIVGATYANQIDLDAIQSMVEYSYIYNASGIEVPVDTVNAVLDQKGTVTLPSRYGVGFTLGKRHPDWLSYAWMITGEFNSTKWTTFRDFAGNNGGLKDAYRASVGGYFVPVFAFEKRKRSKSYFALVEYRFGAFYERTQIDLDNFAVLNYGATVGMGFPISFRNLAPGEKKSTMLNFGMVVGNKSNGQPNQLSERYVNLIFGITLGDQWFQKTKYR